MDDIDVVLETTAEHLGFMVAEARAMGMDETEMLECVELVVRAVEIDRVGLRAARDVLRSLNYESSLISLLTKLARRAPPPPPPWSGRTASAERYIARRRAERAKAEAAAAAAEKAMP
ncbi:hypothetical protein [Bradyrhizobium sp. URHD0069]|uniref:hypothetical protein n=1 Tax=Bradyrhizobium sp. URHD0069 TaxID=1380355 RepID=UPI0012DF1EC7|nr:hypothetical protein [Bradyrhizobium sp. URHD0069]